MNERLGQEPRRNDLETETANSLSAIELKIQEELRSISDPELRDRLQDLFSEYRALAEGASPASPEPPIEDIRSVRERIPAESCTVEHMKYGKRASVPGGAIPYSDGGFDMTRKSRGLSEKDAYELMPSKLLDIKMLTFESLNARSLKDPVLRVGALVVRRFPTVRSPRSALASEEKTVRPRVADTSKRLL